MFCPKFINAYHRPIYDIEKVSDTVVSMTTLEVEAAYKKLQDSSEQFSKDDREYIRWRYILSL